MKKKKTNKQKKNKNLMMETSNHTRRFGVSHHGIAFPLYISVCLYVFSISRWNGIFSWSCRDLMQLPVNYSWIQSLPPPCPGRNRFSMQPWAPFLPINDWRYITSSRLNNPIPSQYAGVGWGNGTTTDLIWWRLDARVEIQSTTFCFFYQENNQKLNCFFLEK